MADEHEKIRLELEKLRIQQEQTRIYLDQWRTDVEPLNQERMQSHLSAVTFGQSAMKTLALLNGGALLALPAIGPLFELHKSSSVSIAATCFAIALVCVVTAYLCSFFVMDFWGEAVWHQRQATTAKLNSGFHPKQHPPDETERAIIENREGELRNKRVSRRWKFGALISIFCALLFFILGAGAVAFSAFSKRVVTSDAGLEVPSEKGLVRKLPAYKSH